MRELIMFPLQRGRLLSAEETARLSAMSPADRQQQIAAIVAQLRDAHRSRPAA
jgi:hypothetical protein